jgi:hypothetical protein
MTKSYETLIKELQHLDNLIETILDEIDSSVKEVKMYTPTDGMAAAATRALKWREEGHQGGTMVGLARANQLKNKENLSESTVLRMHSFFSRHAVDKQATGFSSGEEGFPSKGRVAWDLWGGDPGESWSQQKRDQIMRDREGKSLPLAKLIVKGSVSLANRMSAAQILEDYANENINEELEAFGQFMYHAELLRNDHLDVYLIDLHMVDQPYRDMLVNIFSNFHNMES